MGASGDLNNVYNKFGQNRGDNILIILDVTAGDTPENILRMYRLIGKAEAEFPIVMYDDGARALARIISPTTPTSRGPVKLVHPDLEIEKVSDYHEAAITAALNSTKDDGCEPDFIFNGTHIDMDNGMGTFKITNTKSFELEIQVYEAGEYGIEIFNSFGRLLFQVDERQYISGSHTIRFNENSMAKGAYIVKISSLANTEVQKIQITD